MHETFSFFLFMQTMRWMNLQDEFISESKVFFSTEVIFYTPSDTQTNMTLDATKHHCKFSQHHSLSSSSKTKPVLVFHR